MSLLNIKELKRGAARSLDTAAYPPKKLALIHGAITAAALLIISLLDLLLSQQIGATGGLSGMGARAMLSTVQSALSLGISIAMPFWEMGLLYACLQFSRNADANPSSLAEGFRRFGPLLRLMLLESAIYMAVIILAANVSSVIFMMTPLASEFMAATQTIPMEELTAESMMFLMKAAIPLYLLMAAILLILLIPIAYRFRMAGFYLLSDGGHRRALVALGVSNRIMSGNRLSLFKLDLSFWWYYGSIFLLTFIANADMLLNLPGWASYVFYLVYLAGHTILSWQAAAYVQTTYAHAFDTLMAADIEKPMVRNFPWGFLPDHE